MCQDKEIKVLSAENSELSDVLCIKPGKVLVTEMSELSDVLCIKPGMVFGAEISDTLCVKPGKVLCAETIQSCPTFSVPHLERDRILVFVGFAK